MSDKKEHSKKGSKVGIRVTDRRPRFEEKTAEGDSTSATPEKRYPSVVVALEERTRALESKLSEALDLLRRRESEADEFRARLRKEMEKQTQVRVENFVTDFLEVLDSLDRGIAACPPEPSPLREGLARVRDQCLASLARQGVEPMDLVGRPFDPELAEAIVLAESEDVEQDNRVVDEIRRGYTLKGQVLRPAQVRVARRKEAASASIPDQGGPTEK